MTKETNEKVTYTSSAGNLEVFHSRFDDALQRLRRALGPTVPMYIDGQSATSDLPTILDVSPVDQMTLARFHSATAEHVDRAVRGARQALTEWEAVGWRERVRILRGAAAIIRERKYDIAALAAVEVGKSRLEAMGEVEEAADLIDYYCGQMEDANGFVRTMNRITPWETNVDVLRPYGVFACIAPFNFPVALPCGMSAAALVAGNTVVFKPAEATPWTGLKVYEVYRDAGVPPGVFQYLNGVGEEMGDDLWSHPGVDGVVFTGSRQVGMRIFKGLSSAWVKPCLLEMGGKNAAIVMDSADIDAAAEGVMRSTWGLQNQKCSATSRVYVHRAVTKPFIDALLDRTAAMRIGDPTERDVFFGPVIGPESMARFERAVSEARETGEILTGGGRMQGRDFERGYFLEPTVARLPLSSRLFREELFVPFLAIGEVNDLDSALRESNQVEYGLTAGIFSGRDDEVQEFFRRIEVGLAYANKRSGATTGAWPGAQPFTGWKASGASGKGGCGPYYVQQFMREQCRTTIAQS